ncbi:MAG TPA: hypothetical protein PK449_01640 [Exilispira sp.]|nr:hypothetical protein [Exilispira sp.]
MIDTNLEKAEKFIDHLLELPNIRIESPIGAESQILLFIKNNRSKLEASFKNPEFFPSIPPEQAIAFILQSLQKRVLESCIPFFAKIIDSQIDFSILNKVHKNRTFNIEAIKQSYKKVVEEMLQNSVCRVQFKPIYYIFEKKYLDRSLALIFERKAFTYNELVRVQKCFIELQDYISYLKMLLLLTPYPYLQKVGSKTLASANGKDEMMKICKLAAGNLIKEIPLIDIRECKLAVDSNLPDYLLETWEASSRFLFILISRFVDYEPANKKEKGAESADKSWYGVARKVAQSYGYNKGIVDELYLIANEIK